ncbi:MAG TPA: hypothetical protein DD435_16025 [Cyanobacteria bacterium UBA8530]|nr:hypothetical protein [Cyanobacteria bacterium UBA8530]
MRSSRFAILLASSLLFSGCATTLNAAFERPAPVEVSLHPSESGTLILIKAPEKSKRFNVIGSLGYAVDALLLGDLANLTNSYGSTNEAIKVIGAYALCGIAIDALCGFLGGEINKQTPASLAIESNQETFQVNGIRRVSRDHYEALVPFPSISGVTVRNPYRISLAQRNDFLPAAVEKGASPKLSTTIALEEPIGDNAIHAEEGGTLLLKVSNAGKGIARGVSARVTLSGSCEELSFPERVSIGDIPAGGSKEVYLPIEASKDLLEGNFSLLVAVEDQNQFDAPQARIAFQTRKKQPVSLCIEQVGVNPGGSGVPRRGEQVDIQALVRNKGLIPAREVNASLLMTHSGLVAGGPNSFSLGNIPAGGYAIATFSLFVKNSYDGPQTLPLSVRLFEKTTSIEEGIAVVLEQSSARIDDFAFNALDPTGRSFAPELTVDVDKPLEKTATPNPHAVAVVIGIERYNKKLPGVNFAGRDAQTTRSYFTDLLGIPPENLLFLLNDEATKANIQVAIEEKIKRLVEPGKSEVYVYYAGHGAPDPQSGTPYLIPYDGDPNYPQVTCYPAPAMYQALGKTGAKSTTVILDACFSGQDGRSEKPTALLANSRPLFIQSNTPNVPANVTVFAASGPNQLSSAFPEKRHGLFTYYLLKGLREGGDKVTVGGLQNYLLDQVARQARRMGREQVPMLIDDGKGERILWEKR